jgi:hypothetical protein
MVHFLEVLPGDAQGLQDPVQGLFEIIPPVLALSHAVGEVVEHFMVRPALAHLDDLPPG